MSGRAAPRRLPVAKTAPPPPRWTPRLVAKPRLGARPPTTGARISGGFAVSLLLHAAALAGGIFALPPVDGLQGEVPIAVEIVFQPQFEPDEPAPEPAEVADIQPRVVQEPQLELLKKVEETLPIDIEGDIQATPPVKTALIVAPPVARPVIRPKRAHFPEPERQIVVPEVEKPSSVEPTSVAAPARNYAVAAGSEPTARPSGDSVFAGELRRHLERFKRYPPIARRARMRGETRLAIEIDARGEFLKADLLQGSSHALLDKEAMATAERASPYPKPEDGKSLLFEVTIRFDG